MAFAASVDMSSDTENPDVEGPPAWMLEDPETAELLREFIGRLPQRATWLEERLAAGDLDAVRSEAHQLKGTAGAYGFARITDAAAILEASVKASEALDAVREKVACVAALCRAAGSKS